MEDSDLVVVGKISGHFGVRGWVKIKSFTRPVEQILEYKNWILTTDNQRHAGIDKPVLGIEATVLDGRTQSRNLIASLDGFEDRDSAELLIGKTIQVASSAFGPAAEGEFYWTDLVGLVVNNTAGEFLGKVDHLLETGANDVLVVKNIAEDGIEIERLLPWSDQVVIEVDLSLGSMLVDWDADF